MKRGKLRRFLFVAVTWLLSLPWLTPCGALLIPAAALKGVNSLTFNHRSSLFQPTSKQLAGVSEKPGLPLSVHEYRPVPRSLLISAAEWSRLAHPATSSKALIVRDSSARKGGIATAINGAADFLIRMEENREASQKGRSLSSEPMQQPREQLVLCEFPLVLLEGDVIRYAGESKSKSPALAEAATKTMMANATISTPEGNLFFTAQRICYRATAPELILEGNPTALSGRKQVKAADRNSLMKFNFTTRTVTVGGAALETQF